MSTSVYTASLIEQRPSLQLETWRDIDLSFDTKPAMDNNWQGFNYYYPNDANRPTDRSTNPPMPAPLNAPPRPRPTHHPSYSQAHLPTPNSMPPHSASLPSLSPNPAQSSQQSPHMNLPPFNQSFFGSAYHHPGPQYMTPTTSTHLGPIFTTSPVHHPPSGQQMVGQSQTSYGPGPLPIPSPTTSTAGQFSRALSLPRGGGSMRTGSGRGSAGMAGSSATSATGPYTESPIMPNSALSYTSSPGLHHFSPNSPTARLHIPTGIAPSATSPSSSSLTGQHHLPMPSTTSLSDINLSHPQPSNSFKATPGLGLGGLGATGAQVPDLSSMGKRKSRRRGSESDELDREPWDSAEGSAERNQLSLDLGEETEEQPWGMPQDDYKALNPRDKKQVRNRIGARKFRAKRKDYVNNLERILRNKNEEVSQLRHQVSDYRTEINDLRSRLGIPSLSPPPSSSASGLGLVMSGGSDDWADVKDE